MKKVRMGWVFGCAIALGVGFGGTASAATPGKAEVLKALRTTIKDTKSVSEVFADLGGGRFPILFTVKGRDCIERTVEKQKEQNCSATSAPHAGVVVRDAAGAISLEAELALKTAAAPWDQPEPLKWGVTTVKDHDGDGKPELLVVYGYDGPTVWAVGTTYYRHLALLNLEQGKLGFAFQVALDEKPEASSSSLIETKWKLAPGELQLTRTISDYDDGKGERVGVTTKSAWRYDAAKDAYVEPPPPAKK